MNTDPKFGTAPAALFVKGWGKDVFSLADLNTHGILEHVASLSREDQTVISKSAKVSPLRVATLLADSDTEFITPKSIAKTRTRVEALSAPTKLNVQETVLAYIEASLLLMFMNDGPLPSAGTNPPGSAYKAPKNRVRAFLTEERFPTELGWKVSERTIPVVDLVFVMKAVFEEKEPTGGPFFESYVIKFLKSREYPKSKHKPQAPLGTQTIENVLTVALIVGFS